MTKFDMRLVNVQDKLYSATEVFTAVEVSHMDQGQLRLCLASGEMTLEELNEPSTRISLQQQSQVYAALSQQSSALLFEVEVGRRLHLTAYGFAGFALMSCKTLRDALEEANSLSLLLNLKCQLFLSVSQGVAKVSLQSYRGLSQNNSWYCLEAAKLLTVLKDILGAEFSCDALELCVDMEPVEQRKIEALLSANIILNRNHTALYFKAQWLDRLLTHASAINLAACRVACDEQLSSVIKKYDLRFKVQDMLLDSGGSRLTMGDAAVHLNLSLSTLRRRLDRVGAKYPDLLIEAQKRQVMS